MSSLGFDSDDDEDFTAFVPPPKPHTQPKQQRKPYLPPSQSSDEPLDESVYAYDSVYDSISHTRQESEKKEKPSSNYITSLLEAKTRREQEKLRIQDLKNERERELEGDEFKDKEVFVTSAYKEHKERQKETVGGEGEEEMDMKKFHRAMLDAEPDEMFEGAERMEGHLEEKDKEEDTKIEAPAPLKAGLNLSTKHKTTPPPTQWQPPQKKHYNSTRQAETEHVLRQIEELESRRQQESEKPRKSRLLPKLSDAEVAEYKERYQQRHAAATNS